MKEFSIPEDGSVFVEHVISRCEQLIESGIWDGLHVQRFRDWVANFAGEQERYFAACLLDSLIYRPDAQTESLMIQLFQRVIPAALKQVLPEGTVPDDVRAVFSQIKNDPGMRLVPVISSSDPPIKSGPLVLREMKRRLRLADEWMVSPKNIDGLIKRGVRVFLLIDDFLGTGYQLRRFFREEQLAPHLSSAHFFYFPLVAHVAGLKRLKKKLPPLTVASAETLDHAHGVFSATSRCFADSLNTPESAKAFYQGLLRKRGMNRLGSKEFGYCRLALCFAFQHAVPNASLPLFWYRNDGFVPLFDR